MQVVVEQSLDLTYFMVVIFFALHKYKYEG